MLKRMMARLAIAPEKHDRSSGPLAGKEGAEAVTWQTVVSAMADAAVVLDEAERVIHANGPFAELYPDVRMGQQLSLWLRNPGLMQAIDNAAFDAEPATVTLSERMPVERSISVRVVRIYMGKKERLKPGSPFLLVTFRDLTDQGKLTQMREDFIANASHEMRTPLASLRGFIETLQGPARDDQPARDRFLKLMAGQAERMTRLIDDLLSLSRVEMREHVRPRGIVDMNEVVEYVIETMRGMAESAEVDLVSTLCEDSAKFRGERDEIVQVLSNLIHNAITYGGKGGKVNVSVSIDKGSGRWGQRVRLAVSDTGPGIAKEHLPRLTERFYRPSVAVSRSHGGTGLGLAIVKHIISRHRGELEINSVVGEGATFTVLFDAISQSG
ncbi:MAG: ATP-binding protein [Hyphomicrobiaceae bacterium]